MTNIEVTVEMAAQELVNRLAESGITAVAWPSGIQIHNAIYPVRVGIMGDVEVLVHAHVSASTRQILETLKGSTVNAQDFRPTPDGFYAVKVA